MRLHSVTCDTRKRKANSFHGGRLNALTRVHNLSDNFYHQNNFTFCLECNCDDGGKTSDRGEFRDNAVPIKHIYSLNDPSDETGYVTLGPLVCSGSGTFIFIYS